MSLDTICLLAENGRRVFAREGELIAFGATAKDFLASAPGGSSDDPREAFEPSDGSPSAFLIGGFAPDAQQAVLDLAKANGHRVQPNHVMFFHCGTCCDPCCGVHPATIRRFDDALSPRANPLSANPLSANPLSANPLSANSLSTYLGTQDKVRTSAIRSLDPGSRPSDDGEPKRIPSVLVIDTGLGIGDANPFHGHATITGNDVDRLDSDSDNCVDAVAGHGTFIAGIVDWLTPGSAIEVVRPDHQGFSSHGDVDEFWVARELRKVALDSPEDTIINLSFGGRFYAEQSLLHVEIAAKQARGAVVVASAGNDASCEPSYPAAFPGVIAVGALDGAGKPAAFTNYGSWVNASALGADLVSRFLIPTTAQLKVPKTADSDVAEFEDGWAAWSGTSFAAPVVAAAIARSMQDAGHTAKEAAAAVLAGGSDVACLGRRVEHPNRPAVHVASGNSS